MQPQLGAVAAALIGALLIAFAAAWLAKTERAAYGRGLGFGSVVLFGSTCVAMFDPNPVNSNRTAEEFFWSFPLFLGWVVLGVIAVASARELKRMWEAAEEER